MLILISRGFHKVPIIIISIYSCKNKDSERLRKISKFTKLLSGRAGILTQFKNLAIFHYLHLTQKNGIYSFIRFPYCFKFRTKFLLSISSYIYNLKEQE